MVDIHSHILPGVDDGPETLEDALAMVRMAAAAGTTDIVATPHADLQFRFQPELVHQKIAELTDACGNIPRIHSGCDFHLHWDNIRDALENPARYTINHKRYLLVEFSELLIPKSTDEVFDRMLAAGITPVVTHPERNGLLHRRIEQIAGWVTRGAFVQITGQSFLGRFGREAKSVSEELMKRRLVHFIASDAHDTRRRPPVLTEARQYVAKHYGEERAERLFTANPGKTLTGDDLDPEPEMQPKPRKWYSFWS